MMWDRIGAWLRWRQGVRWLRSGYCPECYSSPPKPSCSVCSGSHKYGDKLSPFRAGLWWERWWARRPR